jgi:hypothetical protein
MGNGQWAMGIGHWAMGNGHWAMGNGEAVRWTGFPAAVHLPSSGIGHRAWGLEKELLPITPFGVRQSLMGETTPGA